ncbi:hypothetical protein ACFV0B_11350 [Streptomyces xanthophaeus]|uniref:hypothetical protein n=1 Tax=Streptomyces xanthophaeus TaxID=67385 RepID=UPI0036AE5D19
MAKATVKIVEARPVFGHRGYSYRCVACGDEGNAFTTRANAEWAAQKHLDRAHRGGR